MKPRIDTTRFGSITIGGRVYDHDVILRIDGSVEKRRKKLSKKVYGSSHTVSETEAAWVFEDGLEVLIVGAGQDGILDLSTEAVTFLTARGVEVRRSSTPEALETYNREGRRCAALFHVTC